MPNELAEGIWLPWVFQWRHRSVRAGRAMLFLSHLNIASANRTVPICCSRCRISCTEASVTVGNRQQGVADEEQSKKRAILGIAEWGIVTSSEIAGNNDLKKGEWLRWVSESHSVLFNSFWSHGLQPSRLPCPYNSPGKNTGVGCHFLLQGWLSLGQVQRKFAPQTCSPPWPMATLFIKSHGVSLMAQWV